MEPAYRARVSIAQPDYTAECLTAQRDGGGVWTAPRGSDLIGRPSMP